MFKAIIVAFSTYSKIPMPRFEWKKEDMKYSMCALPLVGAVIGLVQYGSYVMLTRMATGTILTAVILTLIPLLITGGIHMDGYMDTWDALSSYGDKEKKLGILKDPHVGAFAVIHGICYIMLTAALWHELITRIDAGNRQAGELYIVLSGYILSRTLSGLFALTFKKAKKDGMLSDMTESPDNKGRNILIAMLIVYTLVILYFFRLRSLLLIIPAAAVSLLYRHISYKHFDGISGDLAGWFLQLLELMILAASLI